MNETSFKINKNKTDEWQETHRDDSKKDGLREENIILTLIKIKTPRHDAHLREL